MFCNTVVVGPGDSNNQQCPTDRNFDGVPFMYENASVCLVWRQYI